MGHGGGRETGPVPPDRTEKSLPSTELVLSLHHVVVREGTRVLSLGGKSLYPMRHLAGPMVYYKLFSPTINFTIVRIKNYGRGI